MRIWEYETSGRFSYSPYSHTLIFPLDRLSRLGLVCRRRRAGQVARSVRRARLNVRVEVVGVRHANAHAGALALFDIGQNIIAVGLQCPRAERNRIITLMRVCADSRPALSDTRAPAIPAR